MTARLHFVLDLGMAICELMKAVFIVATALLGAASWGMGGDISKEGGGGGAVIPTSEWAISWWGGVTIMEQAIFKGNGRE